MENVRVLWLTKEKLDTSSEGIQIFSTYGKMQESGLLEIIPLIITWTRASIYSFCLKSVLQATLVSGAVTKDLIVHKQISTRVPPGFTFMDRCNGLCLDACSIICLLIWLENFLVHNVLYSPQPQKKLLSLERLLYSQRSWPCASTWTGLQFSSFAQSCLTLCVPMNCSTPGLRVQYHPSEFTQPHVHRVSDAIQPSHTLSSLSPPASNPSQHQSQRT